MTKLGKEAGLKSFEQVMFKKCTKLTCMVIIMIVIAIKWNHTVNVQSSVVYPPVSSIRFLMYKHVHSLFN